MKIKEITLCAVFSAIFAVCAWIHIPSPIPFTMQTFGIYVALFLLGGKLTTVSLAVYLFLGGLGLPVFSGFQGGVSAMFGATGGFLMGFVVMAAIFWVLETKKINPLFSAALGTIACYAIGTLWYAFVYGGGNAESIAAAVIQCVLPYIVPDVLKMIIANFCAKRLRRSTRF